MYSTCTEDTFFVQYKYSASTTSTMYQRSTTVGYSSTVHFCTCTCTSTGTQYCTRRRTCTCTVQVRPYRFPYLFVQVPGTRTRVQVPLIASRVNHSIWDSECRWQTTLLVQVQVPTLLSAYRSAGILRSGQYPNLQYCMLRIIYPIRLSTRSTSTCTNRETSKVTGVPRVLVVQVHVIRSTRLHSFLFGDDFWDESCLPAFRTTRLLVRTLPYLYKYKYSLVEREYLVLSLIAGDKKNLYLQGITLKAIIIIKAFLRSINILLFDSWKPD